MSLLLSSPTQLLLEWALMLAAMMPLLLAMPLMHVWRSSAVRRRLTVTGMFLLAYFAAWLVAGPALFGLSLLLKSTLGEQSWLVVLAAAVVWSSSPLQRAALNNSHRLKRIGLFGWQAHAEAASFGLSHGGWCIASCWLWMLLPLVSSSWHLTTMVNGGAIMLLERMAPSGKPRWATPAFVRFLQSLVPASSRFQGKLNG